MSDIFKGYAKGLESPADQHFAIVPDDNSDLPLIPRALFCVSSGDVSLRDVHGADMTYAVSAGQILPFRPARVLNTGTTASVIGWL